MHMELEETYNLEHWDYHNGSCLMWFGMRKLQSSEILYNFFFFEIKASLR